MNLRRQSNGVEQSNVRNLEKNQHPLIILSKEQIPRF